MAIRTDLMQLDNGDINLGAKLFTVAPSDVRHLQDIFLARPGDWKQFKQNGIGIADYLKSSGARVMKLQKLARVQIKADGYLVTAIKTISGNIADLQKQMNRTGGTGLYFGNNSGEGLMIITDATR